MLDRREISQILAEREISIKEFAKSMDMSPGIVGLWLSENPDSQRNPSRKNIKLIADALELGYKDITFDTADMAYKSLSRIERVAAKLEASDDDESVNRNAIKLDSLAGAYSKVYNKIENPQPEKEEVTDEEDDSEADIQV